MIPTTTSNSDKKHKVVLFKNHFTSIEIKVLLSSIIEGTFVDF